MGCSSSKNTVVEEHYNRLARRQRATVAAIDAFDRPLDQAQPEEADDEQQQQHHHRAQDTDGDYPQEFHPAVVALVNPLEMPRAGHDVQSSFRRSRRSQRTTSVVRSPRRYPPSPTTNGFLIDVPLGGGFPLYRSTTEEEDGGQNNSSVSPHLSTASLQQHTSVVESHNEGGIGGDGGVDDWVDALLIDNAELDPVPSFSADPLAAEPWAADHQPPGSGDYVIERATVSHHSDLN